jgi:phage baseplate assembly protein V
MDIDDALERTFFRMRNLAARGRIGLVDDTKPVQLHQVELYPGEIRGAVQHFQPFGFSAVPLVGARVAPHWQGGHRGLGSIHGVEDPRYRPTGLQGGEIVVYMVDGAAANGTGGTMRRILFAAAGWVLSLFGKTVNIGTATDTETLAAAGQTITISATGSITITGAAGDVMVNGISLVNHVHTGVMSGSSNSGPPA